MKIRLSRRIGDEVRRFQAWRKSKNDLYRTGDTITLEEVAQYVIEKEKKKGGFE